MSYDVLLNRFAGAKEIVPVLESSPDTGAECSRATTSNSNTPSRKISTSRFASIPFASSFISNKESSNNLIESETANAIGPHSNNGATNAAPAVARTQNTEEAFPEIKGKVESKLMSMWQNVKYGWSGKMRSSFSREQPVWLLGRCYHRKASPGSSMENSAELTLTLENKLIISDACNEAATNELQDFATPELGTDVIDVNSVTESAWEEEGIEGFKRDFMSRIWMTYRREFPIMNGSNYTSDCGWGCMLRSGQMMLAQALVCHFLGRSWRFDVETQLHSTHDDNLHRKILRWFGDSSSRNCPFSIHTLVNLGTESGKKPGDWYGPNSVAHLLKNAVKQASQEFLDLDNLNVYVAQDCTVYLQDVFDECLVPDEPAHPLAPWQQQTKTQSSPNHQPNMNWKSLILLVPLRLGTEKLNPIYANSLKALLSVDYCIGIIGGRPKHSLYFMGFQEDKLIHLDPHYCQENVDVNQENFCVNSFHCKSPRKMKLSKMDPSCCIGFYCQTRTDFDKFVQNVQPFLLPQRPTSPQHSDKWSSSSDINYPMFAFCRSRSTDQTTMTQKRPVYTCTPPTSYSGPSTLDDEDDDDTEEFVII